MTTTFDARAFVKDFVNAIDRKDPESVLHYYADNVELTDPTTPQPLRGKDGIRKNLEQWGSAMSETSVEIKEALTSGNKAVVLFEARGRHTGELELGPGERIPATNKPVRLEMANFLTLDNQGKVTKDHTIFDAASLMMQLGLMPDMQRAGATPERGASTSTRGR